MFEIVLLFYDIWLEEIANFTSLFFFFQISFLEMLFLVRWKKYLKNALSNQLETSGILFHIKHYRMSGKNMSSVDPT